MEITFKNELDIHVPPFGIDLKCLVNWNDLFVTGVVKHT